MIRYTHNIHLRLINYILPASFGRKCIVVISQYNIAGSLGT